jgi:hypothetical protein
MKNANKSSLFQCHKGTKKANIKLIVFKKKLIDSKNKKSFQEVLAEILIG